jgi:hypothetical protein
VVKRWRLGHRRVRTLAALGEARWRVHRIHPLTVVSCCHTWHFVICAEARDRNGRHLPVHGDVHRGGLGCAAEDGAAAKAPYERADEDKRPALTRLAEKMQKLDDGSTSLVIKEYYPRGNAY